MRAVEPADPSRSEGAGVFPKKNTRRPRWRRLHAGLVHAWAPQTWNPSRRVTRPWRYLGERLDKTRRETWRRSPAPPGSAALRTGLGGDCQRPPIVRGPPQPTRDSLRANAGIRKQSLTIHRKRIIRFYAAALNVGGSGDRYSCVGSSRNPAREGNSVAPDSDIRSSDPVVKISAAY